MAGYGIKRALSAVGLLLVFLFPCPFAQAFEMGDLSNMKRSTIMKLNRLYSSQLKVLASGRQLPIIVPPASEVLEYRKNLLEVRPKGVPKQVSDDSGVDSKNILLGSVPIQRAKRNGRSIPSKSEFVRMLKTHPADARQLMEKYKIDVSSISPIRQLPSGARQLPEDTRRRPAGTW